MTLAAPIAASLKSDARGCAWEPASIHQLRLSISISLVALMLACQGCGMWSNHHDSMQDVAFDPNAVQNPLFVPATDREFLWSQLVDEVDNYFDIIREERVQVVNGVLTEGYLETRPRIGSTILEPWRSDSQRGYPTWLATFQTIRRTAKTRVIPTQGGYLVDLLVNKEIEDLDKPQHATAAGTLPRFDSTLNGQQGRPGRFSTTKGWIGTGRDSDLEARILTNLRDRVCPPDTVARRTLHGEPLPP